MIEKKLKVDEQGVPVKDKADSYVVEVTETTEIKVSDISLELTLEQKRQSETDLVRKIDNQKNQLAQIEEALVNVRLEIADLEALQKEAEEKTPIVAVDPAPVEEIKP